MIAWHIIKRYETYNNDRAIECACYIMPFQRAFLKRFAKKNIKSKVFKENIRMAIEKFPISLN